MKILNVYLTTLVILISILALITTSAQAGNKGVNESAKQFKKLKEMTWTETFRDPCTMDWETNWTLDGEKAKITNNKDGMKFVAGPKAFSDPHHAVLWTKKSFKGDIKIEYDYTRTDKENRMVNIIYIQATGSGKPGFDKDISKWAEKRKIPIMKTYFNNMNTYHISYAAFGTKNTIPGNDYIRGRRYMCKGLKGTELENEYFKTGMFKTGVPHRITIIKRDHDVFIHIKNSKKEILCHLVNSKFPPITEGNIGLRHMYTRGARYTNFTVSSLTKDKGMNESTSKEKEE